MSVIKSNYPDKYLLCEKKEFNNLMRLSRLLVIIFRYHIPGVAGMGGSCIASEFDEVGARDHALRVYDHIVALPVVDDQGV